jgi:hypothetical protein
VSPAPRPGFDETEVPPWEQSGPSSNGDEPPEVTAERRESLDALAGDDEAAPKSRAARDVLVDLALTYYVIGRTEDERTYLVPADGPNVALFAGAAKSHLARRYFASTGRAVGRSPLDEAWLTLDGFALDVAKEPLPLRVASHDGRYVIDIGDRAGRAIVVAPGVWHIVPRSPVTFRRSKATLPLLEPSPGGDVAALFEVSTIAEAHRDLYVAWLVTTLVQAMPHPMPTIRGEQGSGKSTAGRTISRIVDPSAADTQRPPRDDQEWAQSCSARWVMVVDNVSAIHDWWSDALCRTVTGDGWIRRALYTDDDVIVSSWRRCVVLNGIDLGATLRPDLAERLILFELVRPSEFLTEEEVAAKLDEIRPAVLGALLDRAAATLAALDTIEPVRDLRMADFSTFLAAYDAAHGTTALAAYRRQVDVAFAEALDADVLATAVVDFMTGRDEWEGTCGDLLKALAPYRPDDETKWPSRPHVLSRTLTRSASTLRRVGIDWERPSSSGRSGRTARLVRSGTLTAPGNASSPSLVFGRGGEEEEEEEEEANTTREDEAFRSARSVPDPPNLLDTLTAELGATPQEDL